MLLACLLLSYGISCEATSRRKTIKAEDVALTPELVSKVAINKTVVITQGTFQSYDFVYNWVQHLAALNISQYLVAADDLKLVKALVKADIQCFLAAPPPSANQRHKPGRRNRRRQLEPGVDRASLISQISHMGFTVVFSDNDCVWQRQPFKYFAKFPHLDILVSSDLLTMHRGQRVKEELDPFAADLNTDFVMVRPTPAAQRFVDHWAAALQSTQSRPSRQSRQGAAAAHVRRRMLFSGLLRQGHEETFDLRGFSYKGWNGSVPFGVLPTEYWPSGRAFAGDYHEQLWGNRPFVAHVNYMGTRAQKRHMLREYGAWFEAWPQFYHHPGGYMLYEPNSLAHLLRRTLVAHEPDAKLRWKANLELLQHQWAQVTSAFAVAHALGRALILPRIWTGYRAFCNIEAAWARHPVHLPAFGLYHIANMERALPEQEYGPHIPFRDFAFLTRRGLPSTATFLWSTVDIQVCRPEDQPCSSRPVAAPLEDRSRETYLIPGNLTDEQLRQALEGLGSDKVLRFTGITHAFGGFVDPAATARFRRRLDLYHWPVTEHNMSGSWMGIWPNVVNQGEAAWPVLEHIPRSQRAATQP
ncbi:hypothetical protein WJX72_009129 [[Myrmecia] bisecta]|uniref:Nucleotide-diphospho-sugar transferase domain-containing protein n=1 Tax=[Myrmecia] bisecta TaxID=41462 RepID=A0AAW1PKE6_9CHLO